MNKRRLVVGVLSMSLLAAALPGLASAQDEAVPYPAEGVQWQLSSYADGGTMTDVPAGVETTLFLNGGEVVGSAGCNSYFGSYQMTADTLTFPNPFGSTQKFCDGPEQAVEDAYLPLLQAVAGWSIDEAGMLSLTDADGAVSLVYGEPPVTVTATDVEALNEELTNLQAQIDQAAADVATLAEEFSSVNVTKLRNRIAANEQAISDLDKTVARLRDRIKANEEAIASLDEQMASVKTRVKALEKTDKAQDQRIAALEEAAPQPTQLPS